MRRLLSVAALAALVWVRWPLEIELRVYARHSTATADIAMPFVAARRASIRLPPIGTLGLDPGTMIPIPAAPVPQPAGVASFVLPVPNHPALYGVTVHAQAVVVPTPGSPRSTNVISETVLR